MRIGGTGRFALNGPSGRFAPSGPTGKFQPRKPRYTEFYGTNMKNMNRAAVENLRDATLIAGANMFSTISSASEQLSVLYVQQAANRAISEAKAKIDAVTGEADKAMSTLAGSRSSVDISA